MLACENVRPEIVRLLLTHPKIDINLVDYEGNRAIDIAIFKENMEIIEMLLARDDIDLSQITAKPTGVIYDLICQRCRELGQPEPTQINAE